MPMLLVPSEKYAEYPPVPLKIREWPARTTTSAPIWLSTDLRDGNQALVNPMSSQTKLRLFKLLCKIGFKQIEVSYPSSSDQEFQFTRSLIDNNEIPDDVAIQVITPCREDLIRRSIDSLAGAKHAIVHLYNAVSPVFRDVVFRNSRANTIELVVNSVKLVRQLADECTLQTGTHFQLNYCMETFSQTEPEFAVELGNAVLDAWGRAGAGDDRVMFNMAATVECAPPNYYADQVEYFCKNINQRENVIASIHPHNDRGTGVAAAELALLAGGDRIEGCLLGNGERTGNVDIITLALNLYTRGISPNLDFSDLKTVIEVVSECNDMKVHPRYPYCGELVFTAFAGTHQDAIKKGFDAQHRRHQEAERTSDKKLWMMPYIPIDPADLGFGYENLIRVSSQSGKAGATYIVKNNLQLDLPRRMQVSFYNVVQSEADGSGKEMTVPLILDCFRRTFFLHQGENAVSGRMQLHDFELFSASPSETTSPLTDCSSDSEEFLSVTSETDEPSVRVEANISVDGESRKVVGEGIGRLLALSNAIKTHLSIDVNIHEFTSHTIDEGSTESKIASFIEVSTPDVVPSKNGSGSIWGVGVSSDKSTSRFRAFFSAINSVVGEMEFPRRKAIRLVSSHLRNDRDSSRGRVQNIDMRTGSIPHSDTWQRPERPNTPVQ